jgi:D-alanyl-D-alanine carboxypeptidase (penicillin-binding protein 5/6)
MGAPNYKIRFKEAEALLEYGFSICKLYTDKNLDIKQFVKVKGGESEQIKIMAKKIFNYVSTKEEDLVNIKKISCTIKKWWHQ